MFADVYSLGVDCYAKLTKERPNLSRYRLEAATTSVSFTCRSTDGPAEVMGVLHRLQEMVELVNQAATAAVRAEQEQSKVKQHPAAKGEGTTAASLAAGLVPRLAGRSPSLRGRRTNPNRVSRCRLGSPFDPPCDRSD